MTATRRHVSHEQKNVEKLLEKLAKLKPGSAKPSPIADARVALRSGSSDELRSVQKLECQFAVASCEPNQACGSSKIPRGLKPFAINT